MTTIHRITNLIDRPNVQAHSRLRTISADGNVGECAIPSVGLTVGADRSCDVVLSDSAISRRHLTVAPVAGGFRVSDLGSTNGSWVDGVAVTEATVPVGTSIRIGKTILQLLPAEETVDVPPSERASFGALFGSSLVMRRVFALLERASASSAPILLLGESGTGKEIAARAVHEYSPRKAGPFVVFDCGAASESLIESELFGHKKGAFTGAHGDHPGAFARAHGGTLFLDEIGDLPLSVQPKLLRMLERGEVTPVGGKKTETYDVRFVAATHRDLSAEASAGTFRGDLFYRLSVVEAHLPPLRQRTEDIPELVRLFLRANGRSDEGVAGKQLDRLLSYTWPGNVRELRNVMMRACALSAPGASFTELPILQRASTQRAEEPMTRADVPYHAAKEAILERFEREYLADLLRRHGDNLSEAARVAGLERKYLYRLLEKAGLSRDEAR